MADRSFKGLSLKQIKLIFLEGDSPTLGFSKKFDIFLDLVLNESSYYQLFTCTNSISRKILVLELQDKMLSANETAGFLNHLKKKKEKRLLNQLDFWHDDIDSKNLKECFLVGCA